MAFILEQLSRTHCNYAALVREACVMYISVKRLCFYLQDKDCTILYDHKPLEKYLKGKTKNIKINN